MTMDRMKKGQSFKIVSIPNAFMRTQAIRLGIAEGTVVFCEEVIPAGPVVIRKNGRQIALGRGVARQIGVAMA